jgi:acylphosphatase
LKEAAVSESSLQRRELVYAGNVQGVGFRFTAQRIAQGYKVAGFVRNLRDGRVQLAVEGQPQEIDAFLDDVQTRMRGYIRDVTENETTPAGGISGFEIRF